MKESLDSTIVNICEWINNNLEKVDTMDDSQTTANIVSTLAELVSARANLG